MTEVHFNPKSGLFEYLDTQTMTPQQRANLALLRAAFESEYERGFKQGIKVGRAEIREKVAAWRKEKLDSLG